MVLTGESAAAGRRWSRVVPWLAGPLMVMAALALYRPAMRIGLLSDDFALLMWARQLELAPADWGQIRPLPIVSWWVVTQLTATAQTPAVLHALNVALHGVNAALVWAIGRRLTGSIVVAAGAAALYVALPTSVEPVAWASGIFDVMLATAALALTVVVTTRPELRLRDWIAGLLLTVLMIGAKETGVIAGFLVLLVTWARWGRVSRSVARLASAQLALAAAYTIARELTGRLDHRLTPVPDLAGMARLVSGSARAFLLPMHADVYQAHPPVALAWILLVIAVFSIWFVRRRASPVDVRLAWLAAGGTLLCGAPAIRLFGITADLQGTRYVYLASAWWALALAAALLNGWTARRARGAAVVVTIIAVAAAALLTRYHLQYWTAARAERDRILRAVIALPSTCHRVSVTGVTDNVGGAYVFRNGLHEAVRALGRSFDWVEPGDADRECRLSLEPLDGTGLN